MMSFPLLDRLAGGASKTPPTPVAGAAERLAAAQACAVEAEAAARAAHARYEDAVADGSGPNSPAAIAAWDLRTKALAAADRATRAVQVAERQHAAALAKEREAVRRAEWDACESKMATWAAKARRLAEAIAVTAEARAEFAVAGGELVQSLPNVVKSSSFLWSIRDMLGAGTLVELERAGVLDDPRKGLGLPAATPLADTADALATRLNRERGKDARHD